MLEVLYVNISFIGMAHTIQAYLISIAVRCIVVAFGIIIAMASDRLPFPRYAILW